MKDIERLEKIADRDNCDGDCDLEYPHWKCPECAARSALNEIGEIIRNARAEVLRMWFCDTCEIYHKLDISFCPACDRPNTIKGEG